ncbi:hypothetical protein FTUN_4092 [Frigoriglobus tundricola]|uniref:Uncharacterized protein n=1 Tax=Frigoriglobus tundricola TaxID=2774151 RepID=A0A6M5YR64_9BACT|nr:hypothetical protein FTUN_4092 [Frigoriglobus tundricola]
MIRPQNYKPKYQKRQARFLGSDAAKALVFRKHVRKSDFPLDRLSNGLVPVLLETAPVRPERRDMRTTGLTGTAYRKKSHDSASVGCAFREFRFP